AAGQAGGVRRGSGNAAGRRRRDDDRGRPAHGPRLLPGQARHVSRPRARAKRVRHRRAVERSRRGGAMRRKVLIFVVAYQAESTLAGVLKRIPPLPPDLDVEVLVIDDSSSDRTFEVGLRARVGGGQRITVLYNPTNQGYGGNQKLGYAYAIRNGFDFVVLLHGDGQYAPERIPNLLQPLIDGSADAGFGSRMRIAGAARRGGMPFYKYLGNRVLTWCQNRLLGTRLSEFHSGFRAYRVAALARIPFQYNANVFHFDTEIIIQLVLGGFRVVETPIPTYYGDEI